MLFAAPCLEIGVHRSLGRGEIKRLGHRADYKGFSGAWVIGAAEHVLLGNHHELLARSVSEVADRVESIGVPTLRELRQIAQHLISSQHYEACSLVAQNFTDVVAG